MYFDAFSGAAGDMLLGALLDAGLPLAALERALGTLAVGSTLRVSKVMRAGLSATRVVVEGPAGPGDRAWHSHTHSAHDHDPGHADDTGSHAHGHRHDHHADGHRTLDEIAHLIDHSALSTAGKSRAKALFGRLGDAEAAIHDLPLDQVHLHEVGTLDSIIDIVGVVFALEWFGIDDIVASPLNVGGGTVEIAHGQYPVPAPATARLLTGVPVYSAGPAIELLTPTGALLLSDYVTAYGPMPAMRIDRVGYGAGTKDLPGRPNVLRVLIGERQTETSSLSGAGSVLKLECEIDDMNPQLFGPATDLLFEAGALDVFLTPVQMKKGRPGTLLTVLCPPDRRQPIADVLFRETTTLGVRYTEMARDTLARRWDDVAVTGGRIRVKVAERGGVVMNASPEFDDCRRVAEATGRPVKAVQADALHAWQHLQKAARHG